jgi:hypothetical protein
VSDSFVTRNAGQPLEERVQIQALSIDLREAVMACLCGRESRRWTVAELVERLKNLGVCAILPNNSLGLRMARSCRTLVVAAFSALKTGP